MDSAHTPAGGNTAAVAVRAGVNLRRRAPKPALRDHDSVEAFRPLASGGCLTYGTTGLNPRLSEWINLCVSSTSERSAYSSSTDSIR